uniref:Uncharacterized protein n=1 Tax=Arundo donax TaxID=35708 RepID=A0A0A9GAU0_ARUDO
MHVLALLSRRAELARLPHQGLSCNDKLACPSKQLPIGWAKDPDMPLGPLCLDICSLA